MLQKLRYGLLIPLIIAFFLFKDASSEIVNATCLVLILLFGIPHGAVDHKIHLSTTEGGNVTGYVTKYLLIAVGYILWWLIDPAKALLMFILLSSYHFGQELLEDMEFKQSGLIQKMLWGSFILISPLIYHFTQVKAYLEVIISSSITDFNPALKLIIPLVISILAVSHLLFLFFRNKISKSNAVRLGAFIGFIISSQLILSFITAFTLYFIFFHSLNAFQHQFLWLKENRKDYRLKHFIVDLSRFSLVSIIGILVLLWIIDPSNSYSLITYFFILTSLITLPHAITLDHFYRFRSDYNSKTSSVQST